MARLSFSVSQMQLAISEKVHSDVHIKFVTQEDNKLLTDELGSEEKKYVEIPDASHFLSYEKGNAQYFKAVKDFLEAKIKAKKAQ